MSSKSTLRLNLAQMVFALFVLFIGLALAKFVFSVAMTMLVWAFIGIVALAGMSFVLRLFSGQ